MTRSVMQANREARSWLEQRQNAFRCKGRPRAAFVVLMAMAQPPRILDPKSVPVAGTDAHLPPVPAERLTPQALQSILADTTGWVPERPGDGGRVFAPDRQPAAAAVLVPLVVRDGGLQVLLTRRTDHLRDHAGQISFPGGRSEPEDNGPEGTALRSRRRGPRAAPCARDRPHAGLQHRHQLCRDTGGGAGPTAF
jgi:hypothetical protein